MSAQTLSGTAWIIELGLRVTLSPDGVFRTLRGFAPDIDPSAVHFVTDRTVGNLAARDGSFRIIGDTCSPTRLATLIDKSTKGIDRVMTLDDLAEHKYLGKGWTADFVRAAYAEDEAAAA